VARNLREAVAVKVEQRRRHAIEIGPTRQILQPRYRRLRAQRVARYRQPVERQLEHWIAAQRIAVIAVLIARDDRQRAEADDLGDAMRDPPRRARVDHATRQPIGNPQPALDLAEHQQPAIRRQMPAIEAGHDRLVGDR